jgi:pilus assembly protein CpaE
VGEAVQLARDEQGRAFVVCVADTIAPDLYKQLVRTRSGDWVKWQTCVQELRDLVAGLKSADMRQPTAKVLSFAASKGGVGNTTLALETAIYLATRRKRGSPRVAILDLNLQGGTLADALDIEPRFDIAEIAGRPERLDEQLIDVFTSRHSSGLDVFASPAHSTGMDDLDPQIVFAFIDSLSSRYDAILLDLPQHRLPWTDNLLQGADVIVVSGGSHVPALRRLTAKLAHLQTLAIPESRLAAVVNHCSVDLLGRFSHRAEIERALAGHRTFFVRRDCDAVGGASNVGGSLMQLMPNSRVCRDIKRLAEWVETASGGRTLQLDSAARSESAA